MKRREFIIALGCAAVWPLAALAQQAASRIVGVLGSGSLEAVRTSFAPAQRRLAEMGFVEGRNLGTFATREAAEKHERAVQFFERRGG